MDPLFSTSVLLTAAAVLLFTIAFLIILKRHHHHHKTAPSSLPLPPGPQGMERLRGLWYMLRTGRTAEMVTRWAEQYGDVVRVEGMVPGHTCVFLNDPADVREFYAGKTTRDLVNSRVVVNHLNSVLSGNITFSSPENSSWAKERKLFHQALKFYGEGYQSLERTIQQELQNVVKTLKGKAAQDLEVRPFFFNSVLNVVHILLTGEHLKTESPIRQDMAAYIVSLMAVLNPGLRLKVQYFPFLLYLPGSVKTTWDNFRGNFNRVIQYFYHNVKATHEAGKVRGIVDVWIDKMYNEESEWMTEQHVRGMISDVFTGGTMTTSESLTSLFLILLHRADVVSRIQAEVERVVGPEGQPSLEQREQCPYTQATLLETHRVLSLLPLSISHRVIADTTFKGYSFPKGTLVFANQWGFHRSKALWGDPLEFRPERFLDEEGQLLPATHPLRQQMLPFGVGMRSCPGESFARARMFLYVTTILHHFDPLPPSEGEDLPALTPDLDSWTMSAFMVVKGYRCQFRGRQKQN